MSAPWWRRVSPRGDLGRPPWEVRALRVVIGLVMIGAAISTLNTVLTTEKPILEANKLEVGMMIGWIIAKTGTVIDWLFGGSESGTRRADAQAHNAGPQSVQIDQPPDEPVPVKPEGE